MNLWFWKIDKNLLKIFEKCDLSLIQSVIWQQQSIDSNPNACHLVIGKHWTVMNKQKNYEKLMNIERISTAQQNLNKKNKKNKNYTKSQSCTNSSRIICFRSIKTIFNMYNVYHWYELIFIFSIKFEINSRNKVPWKVDASMHTWKQLCRRYRLVVHECCYNRSRRPNNAFSSHLLDSDS